jgi:hypothetical protein
LRNVIGSDGTTLYFVLERSWSTAPEFDARGSAGRWPVPRAGAHLAVAGADLADRQSGDVAGRQVAGTSAHRRLRDQYLGIVDSSGSGDRSPISASGRRSSRAGSPGLRMAKCIIFAAVGEGDADIVRLSGFLELVTD